MSTTFSIGFTCMDFMHQSKSFLITLSSNSKANKTIKKSDSVKPNNNYNINDKKQLKGSSSTNNKNDDSIFIVAPVKHCTCYESAKHPTVNCLRPPTSSSSKIKVEVEESKPW